MERQQYDEAGRFFSRALRLSAKEGKNTDSKNGEDDTNLPISANTAGKRGINTNSKNDAALYDTQRNFEAELKNYFTMEPPACSSTTGEGKLTADSTTNRIESSFASNAPSPILTLPEV